MHVVIVGCGRVGSGLARILEERDHSVAVIDKNPRAFRRLYDDFRGRTVTGVGFDRDRLAEAGIAEASALAAVTNGDNSNILVARVARENFGVDNVVARIYDPKRAVIYERLGIPTIATVQWTTDRVLHRLFPESEGGVWVDPSAAVVLVERPVPARWAGHQLEEIELPGVARVVALTRMGVAQVATPDLVAQEGDTMYLAVDVGKVPELQSHLGVAVPTEVSRGAGAGGTGATRLTGTPAATSSGEPDTGAAGAAEAGAGRDGGQVGDAGQDADQEVDR
jgi:trk system potassium uptake protein TrkA